MARPRGSSAELEARRRLAVQRVKDGWKQADVAAFLGVELRSVERWVAADRAQGDGRGAGLAAVPRPQNSSPLCAHEAEILGWLENSPRMYGFANDLWTARRVRDLIDEKLGLRFHHTYISGWLLARRITPQKPQRQAAQRDEAKIAQWQSTSWPEILSKAMN